jgi:hypothetical protein
VSDYPVVTIETAGQELERLHGVIAEKMRSTVQDAIRAGQILTQVKERLPHGEFLPWLKANCSISPKTADRYRQLYEYSDKIVRVTNLQEAYQQIETIEKQQKQSEEERAAQRVREYRDTGVKPEGWRRGTDDKLLAEAQYQEQRSKDMRQRADELNERIRQDEQKKAEEERRWKEQQEQAEREARERAEQQTEPRGFWIDEDMLKSVSAETSKRNEFKDRIRLSDGGKDDPFVEAIMDYLEELSDDNRRIEACYNIIKVARGIASELQRETA